LLASIRIFGKRNFERGTQGERRKFTHYGIADAPDLEAILAWTIDTEPVSPAEYQFREELSAPFGFRQKGEKR
jgi:hypothetical protein